MAVLIAMFLLTIIAHDVTPKPNLECWECHGTADGNGIHRCNNRENFKLIRCGKGTALCMDLVYKDSKYMGKQCMSEENWKKLKPTVENQLNIGWNICDTTKCNTKIFQDYFTVNEKNDGQNKTQNLPRTPAPEGGKVTLKKNTVTSDLECWGCFACENKNGTHPCANPNNFKRIKY